MCTNNIYTFFLLKIRSLFSKIYTFIYFGVRELAKSHAMRAIHASVVYLPTCQKHANFSFFTCQRANKRANVPMGQKYANFSTWRANLPKGVPFFQLRLPNGVPISQLFFKRIMFSYIPKNLYFIPNIFYTFCIF